MNKRLILDMIRFAPGGISRASLARQMDLTRSAVTAIINDLITRQLVRETGAGPAAAGRRPISLEINPQRGHIVGIDMGATHLSLVLTDFSAQVLDEIETTFDVRGGPQYCLKQVDENLHALLAHSSVGLADIQAIGMGVPGPISQKLGGVSAPPIMPGWDNFPIRSELEALWQRPVAMGNDANFGALGEWAYGAGRGEQNLAYIKVGSGVGAGFLLNGHIYGGASGCAGEIGHVTIREDGPLCTCGSYGCLEAMSGGIAIAQRAIEAIRAGRRTQLTAIRPVETISATDVARAARLGDLVAQQIVTAAGSYLGIAIASLVNLVNPGMVVIGGGVAQMGDLLLDPIRQAVHARSLRPAAQAVRISTAVLGRRSSSIGAVVQAINLALDGLVDR